MKKIDREILRLSVPTIVSNVTIPLLGICDTAISGHLGSELFLSAIAVASVMFNVMFWIFGFLRGGTTGLTANALGSGNDSEISKVFYRGLLIGLGAGALLIACQYPIFTSLLYVTGATEDIRDLVYSYFRIRIWGAPALLSIIAISGWFVGMQTTFYPMLIAISTNVINIISSYCFAFPMGMGFEGVALGTLISNWVGLAIAVGCVLVFRKGKFPSFSIHNVMKGRWSRYFLVNGNLFLRSFCIICVTMGVTSAGARLGNLTLAVNVIVMQFFQFFSFFIDGFAYSGEAMVGLRAGEGNLEKLSASVRRLLIWSGATGILFSICYYVGCEGVASMLTDSGNVIAGVVEMQIWIALIPIISCWAFIYDGFYIGITDTFRMMISALAGGILFFAIIFFPGIRGATEGSIIGGNDMIWIAFLSYLLLRSVYLAAEWPAALRKRFLAAG